LFLKIFAYDTLRIFTCSPANLSFKNNHYKISYAKIFKNNHYKIALKAIIKAIVIISDTLPTGAKRRHLLLL